jgi:hypothetical protein
MLRVDEMVDIVTQTAYITLAAYSPELKKAQK